MPVLRLLKPGEAPPPSRVPRAMREQQQRYEEFVRGIELNEVGDLQLDAGENLRSVKVRLRRAALRLGEDLDIWDANGRVYFRRVTRRRRPRRQTAGA